VRTTDDLLTLLDGLFSRDAGRFWEGFYEDRDREVPFFVTKPDESLAGWLEQGGVPAAGRALDLGCGAGRNALFLAERGFEVDAVDLSSTAIDWARERAAGAGTGAGAGGVRFVCGNAFAPGAGLDGPYDLIVDSGCLHHLPPHRRAGYLDLLHRTLAPGGHLALACFASGAMGSELSDVEVYRARDLEGGLSFTPEDLRWLFEGLTEVEIRRMRDEPEGSELFGEGFLWAALFRAGRDLPESSDLGEPMSSHAEMDDVTGSIGR
jgi:SAM-dependent methyltransferase